MDQIVAYSFHQFVLQSTTKANDQTIYIYYDGSLAIYTNIRLIEYPASKVGSDLHTWRVRILLQFKKNEVGIVTQTFICNIKQFDEVQLWLIIIKTTEWLTESH